MAEKKSPEILLASASPRRRELLSQIGIDAIAQAVDIDETRQDGEQATDYVMRLACDKARAGCAMLDNPDDLPVLGSDTVVECDGEVLLKPVDRQDAARMLRQLSAGTHRVHTAVAIFSSWHECHALSTSKVRFTALSETQIDLYLASGEADDKAGAYGIQGIAAQFIEYLEGSYSGVMGLPLFETRQLLLAHGIEPLSCYNSNNSW